MKKAESQHTIVGTAKWQRFPELSRMWKEQRRIVLLCGGAVTLVLLGVLVWWLQFSGNPSEQPVALGNGYEKSLRDLQKQELPKEPIDQVYYYSQLGQNNRALGRYQEALNYYLKAQNVVDAHDLSSRASFFGAIADMHDKLGHKIDAGIYRKRAEDRLHAAQQEPAQNSQESAWE